MLPFENHFTTKDPNDTKDLYCGVGLIRGLGYNGSALRCSSIQGDGQADVDGPTRDSIASKAVGVNLD